VPVTSELTFSFRVGPDAGTIYVNGTNEGRLFGGALGASLVVEEIKG
jgi:hypothetical protein